MCQLLKCTYLIVLALDGVLALDRAGVGHRRRLARLVVHAGATGLFRLAFKLSQKFSLPGGPFLVSLEDGKA